MPVLMIAEVHCQTQEGYERIFKALAPLYAKTPGFIAHLSHPMDGGWCVMDVWASREQFQQFFGQHVVDRLDDRLRPKIRFQQLHDAFTLPAKSPQ